MALKFIIEFNERRQIFTLDEFTKPFLEAVRNAVRQEVEWALSSRPVPNLAPLKELDPNRPVALSKARAAQALGVSVRTIDNCIAQQRIRVLRIGRRVLVPMDSIQPLSRTVRSKRAPAHDSDAGVCLACLTEVSHQLVRVARGIKAVGVF